MLQQTQVATVIPYFRRFIEAHPTIKSLSSADEQQILRLWQGLGYYSRARNLLKAAKMIVEQFDGVIPMQVDELLRLPGVGRYTAGAIASIAYDTPAPIVDGNVSRVICRIDAITKDPRDRNTLQRLWLRAAELIPSQRVGDFNQSMMELGATICTPKNPSCEACPIRRFCKARKLGIQDAIPVSKKSKPSPIERRLVICIRDREGRYLIEQRPLKGRWAGMWQFITIPAEDTPPTTRTVKSQIGVSLQNLKPLTVIHHTLTHRQYHFQVYVANANTAKQSLPPRHLATLAEMEHLPFSKPQVAIRALLQAQQ